LIAQTRARLDRPADAAIAFMQIPILFPRHRELAEQSLLEAARQLEKIGDHEGAQRLKVEGGRMNR
jgi:hypothetical protein